MSFSVQPQPLANDGEGRASIAAGALVVDGATALSFSIQLHRPDLLRGLVGIAATGEFLRHVRETVCGWSYARHA